MTTTHETTEPGRRAFQVAIIETDVFGALAYHARCLEEGCEWQTQRYNRTTTACRHASEHGEFHARMWDMGEAPCGCLREDDGRVVEHGSSCKLYMDAVR
jgi:hypothetical protein